ncbi:MAG TPA: class I SAM-dependent methyltransferase [Rhizomicrobium sp.]|nr:class I SAM-dependent methyltransferase [Rhizomicrobium sp.]
MSRKKPKVSQAQRPQGFVGKIFGWLMGRLNYPAYRWTVEQLRAAKPKSFLEIGFGTGHLDRLVAKKLKPQKIAGVDPSPLMVETAQKRMRRFRKKIKLDLHEGDDTRLPKDGPYDAIAALHSFQFWTHPATTLAEIKSLLSPGGRFILVLRLHGKRSKVPNPLSRAGDEVSKACKALQDAGFTIHGMRGLSGSSHGIVAGVD